VWGHRPGDVAEKACKRDEALKKRLLIVQTSASFAMRRPKNNWLR
jgi:hypothetical protein